MLRLQNKRFVNGVPDHYILNFILVLERYIGEHKSNVLTPKRSVEV